jgi:DNA modification methylase
MNIIQGDCLEEMKKLPDNSIDCIITDPPYSLPNNQFRPESRVQQRTWGEFSPYLSFFRQFIAEAKRVVKKDGDIVIFCDETFYPVIYPALYANFYATKLLVWNKGRIGMGGIWRRKFELITHSYLQPKSEKSGDSDILECAPIREKLHTSQKPTDLIETIIKKITKEGDVILDPFAGSGSTLVAAKNTGRDYIGIEIEESYIEIIKDRLLTS